MTEAQAHKQAARESKGGDARFVVYVPDQGQDVFNADQVAKWGALVFVEATYISGVKVASTEVVL